MAGGTETRESLLRLLVAAACVGALVLIVVIMSGSDSDRAIADVLGASVAVTFYCLIGSAGWIQTRRGGGQAFLGYVTIVLAALAFAAALRAIFDFELFANDDGVTAFAVTTILALAAGQASALLALSGENDSDGLRVARVGTLMALCALAVMAVIEVASGGRDIGLKAFGVVAVLYLLGAVSLPILRGLQQPVE
jgi:hypothetical protein